MKTMRHLLLSVLLSAFGFFVVHDYIITDVDADTQYELCQLDGESVVLDLPSQVHEHIHILLSIPDTPISLPVETEHVALLGITYDRPHSYISSVQPRPPLS